MKRTLMVGLLIAIILLSGCAQTTTNIVESDKENFNKIILNKEDDFVTILSDNVLNLEYTPYDSIVIETVDGYMYKVHLSDVLFIREP